MIKFKYTPSKLIDESLYQEKIEEARSYVARAQQDDFGGWVDLPKDYDRDEFARIKAAAEKINSDSDYLVCIGIGGSYLGHRAVIEALGGEKGRTKILYTGNSLSPRMLKKVVVLTAVGLLAIAVAGIDIDKLMDGALEERAALISDGGAAAEYAAMRNILLEKGYDIEILANFEPQFVQFNEWWKQLFGESEGKEGKGIYPASVVDSTDLHSMGQYIQEGRRALFETFVEVSAEYDGVKVPEFAENLDGLKYLEGKEMDYINKTANAATREAHMAGGVPVLEVVMPDIDERSLGGLIYFFEMSCALSGFTLGVNPFNQPGVEAYKNRMFELLGKPGYEK